MNGAPILWRVVDEHPYLDREEEHCALTLEAAARLVEDLTGTDDEIVIRDVTEDGGPWSWIDEETGREVTLRLEVEA